MRASRPAAVVMLLENNPYPRDTRVRNEAESLAAAGHDVTVLAPRAAGEASHERINGVAVRRYRLRWAGASAWSYALEYGLAHAQLALRALLALGRGARVLHLHGPPDTLIFAAFPALLLRRRVVFDLHDSAPELFLAKFGRPRALASLLARTQRHALRRATHVIVTNESQRELVRQRAARSHEDVSVVRNGPRAREFRAPPEGRPGELHAPRLIYVGALDVQDGVLELPLLLSAPALSDATLTVVGDGPVADELRRRCAGAGIDGRVKFSGHVPHEHVPALIAGADIGVDPAAGSELNHGSTMIKVIEYMGAGRPLVAYDLRETRRSAGDAALYAPCGDASRFAALVAELARDGARRLQMGRLARERALELSWERSALVLEGLYERLA
jgi:glycosyltransferase involved in cell wall biosynthesis